MADKKAKTLVERWGQDKNPVDIVKGAKKGKKIPVQVNKDLLKPKKK